MLKITPSNLLARAIVPILIANCAILATATLAVAQNADSVKRATECASCAGWNAPQEPFRIFGNVYYVGTHNLSSILIKSSAGMILIDGALPESAPHIVANIKKLGFDIRDVKYILNSHVHFDHAGGIAELQKLSGAKVAASLLSVPVLRRGSSGPDDPQYGSILSYPPVSNVVVVKEGEVIRVGDVAMTAHFTPGHTPGGTTWTWKSCEGERCLDIVYADSQNSISADGFLFTKSKTYPNGIKDFEHNFAVVEGLSCDLLITPHPDASDFWKRVAARDAGDANALIDRNACKSYSKGGRERLAKRIASETGK
ncbi:MAG: subclass B3 metallo-beta-lactamase [Gemmatimonadaceae bacterium]